MANNKPTFDWDKYPTVREPRASQPTFDWDKYPTIQSTPPTHHGILYNMAAGFGNPLIHMVNLLPEAANAAMHAIGFKHFKDPLIPTIQANRGIPYDIGNVASFAVPFGQAAKGAEAVGAGLRELPVIERAMGLVPRGSLPARLAVPTVAGAAAGAATSPIGQRESGAVGGAIGGGVGGVLGEGFGALRLPFQRGGKRVAAAALEPLQNFFNKSISRVKERPSGEVLKNAYENVKGVVDWDQLKPLAEAASKQGKIDATPYYNALNETLEEATNEAAMDPDVSGGLATKMEKLKRPIESYQDAIKLKKNINNLANWDATARNTENRLARLYSGRLGNALDESIDQTGSKAEGQNQEAIRNFANQWRNQRNIYGKLQEFYRNPTTGKFSQSMKNMFDNEDYEKAVQQFVPRANEDASKLMQFRNLVGDHTNADHAILQKALTPYLDKDGQIDALKLGEAVNKNKLSPAIGQLLTDPEQKSLAQIINSKNVSDELIKNPTILKRMARHPFFTAATLGLSAHLGGAPMSAASGMGGAAYLGMPAIQKAFAAAAERKAAELIEKGEWDKLKGVGDQIVKERKRLPKTTALLGAGLGRLAGAGQ